MHLSEQLKTGFCIELWGITWLSCLNVVHSDKKTGLVHSVLILCSNLFKLLGRGALQFYLLQRRWW